MYRGKRVAVVVPAYNEERFIGRVLEGIPEYVDRVYVVDDASTDRTAQIARGIAGQNGRIEVISLETNTGVGGAIITGYRRALEEDIDITAVMAGDDQMDPAYLPALLDPVVEGRADYAKGDRMSFANHCKDMPKFRRLGSVVLTSMTRIASGYWNISDSQNGYTAIRTRVLLGIPIKRICTGFAYENDILIQLINIGAILVNVPHPAIYVGQNSNIRYPNFIIQTCWVLFSRWLRRLYIDYRSRLLV